MYNISNQNKNFTSLYISALIYINFVESGEVKIEEVNIREVLQKAADGDNESFDFLVERFNKNMLTVAEIYVRQEAADIVQNVWVRIYEKRDILNSVENIENWLFYVVKNHCMDFLRKNRGARNIHKISIEADKDYVDSLINSDDVFEIILENQSRTWIYQKIISLGEIYYMPIILHYFDNLKLKEISEILGVSVSTLKGRLYIGRQLLKKALTNNNFN